MLYFIFNHFIFYFFYIMTIIIALKDTQNKRIIIGADKQVTYGDTVQKVSTKIISLPVNITDGYGEIIDTKKMHIAISGYPHLASFLQYGFQVPDMDSNQNFMEYYYQTFIPAFHKSASEIDFIEYTSSQMDTCSDLLLIFKGTVYNIDSNMGVNILDNEFYVAGSGYEVATGSLYTNLRFHPEMNRVDMVKQAIISAGENTPYCDSDVEVKVINYG